MRIVIAWPLIIVIGTAILLAAGGQQDPTATATLTAAPRLAPTPTLTATPTQAPTTTPVAEASGAQALIAGELRFPAALSFGDPGFHQALKATRNLPSHLGKTAGQRLVLNPNPPREGVWLAS